MKRAWLALVVLAGASPAAAQSTAPAETVAGVKWIYDSVKGYLTRSAEQMPEEDYAFRPTAEVRTFAQLLGHIINSHYTYCSTVLGEANPNGRNAEEITAKAEMVTALRDSFAYCDRAYAIPEAKALETIRLYGAERPRFAALAFNASHDFEHYGNIVTYMRLKGMVPPSSQRSGGN
jgi:uncharacterized damage-inducible protein DinB